MENGGLPPGVPRSSGPPEDNTGGRKDGSGRTAKKSRRQPPARAKAGPAANEAQDTPRREKNRAQGHTPRPGRGMFYIYISVLLVIVMTLFSLTIFFELRHIDCEGLTRYNNEQIIGLSGFEWGENLLFLDRQRAIDNIVSTLSYVREAKIEIKLPDRVVIHLIERVPYGTFRQGTSHYVFDEEGVIFDKTGTVPPEGMIAIQGVSVENPDVGINVFSEANDSIKPAMQVLRELYAQNMADSVGVIDGSESFNVKFSYMGRFTVEMGINEDIAGKLKLLDEVVGQIESHRIGIIDLSSKRARYVDDARGGKL